MPLRSSQRPGLRLAPALLAAALSFGLGGCLSRTAPEVTGSIGSDAAANPNGPRAQLATLGRKFEADPADTANAIAYARVLRSLDQTNQAVAVLQQSALRNPRDLAVLGAYGKSLADAGRLKEASDVLSRAHRPESPDWRILSVQGAVADQLGEFAAAQRLYGAALKIVPGEPSVLSNQGLSFALARRLPEAERVLTEAAAHPRADARVRQNLALVMGLQGRFGEAEALLRRDLPPAEATSNLAAMRRMLSQPNSWKAIGQADAEAAGGAGARGAERRAAL